MCKNIILKLKSNVCNSVFRLNCIVLVLKFVFYLNRFQIKLYFLIECDNNQAIFMNKFAINNQMFNQLINNLLNKSIILIITLDINSTMNLRKNLLHL